MFCPDCGTWNRARAVRCMNCGGLSYPSRYLTRWMVSSRLYAFPSGPTSMTFTVTSVSFRSDERKIVASIGPLSSMPSLSGSVVYTRMSGFSSISD